MSHDLVLKNEVQAAKKYVDWLRWQSENGKKLSFWESFGEIEAPRNRAKRFLPEFENLLVAITHTWSIPSSFGETESSLERSNAELVSILSNDTIYDALQGMELDTPFAFTPLTNRDPLSSAGLDSAKDRFQALVLYKRVLDNQALQDKRDDLLAGFLKKAATWDLVKRKVEIQERQEQIEKIYSDGDGLSGLPALALLTVASLDLPDVFSRQIRFLKSLISDLKRMNVRSNEHSHKKNYPVALTTPTAKSSPAEQTPRVFVSYSHDSEFHKTWVLKLATDLRNHGVDVVLDQWDLGFGDDIGSFMEKAIANSDRVLVICTDRYIMKADSGRGGVGYEKTDVTSELLSQTNTNKFIPVIRNVHSKRKTPLCLGTRYYIDFSSGADYQERLESLLRAIHDIPKSQRPAIGKNPFGKDG